MTKNILKLSLTVNANKASISQIIPDVDESTIKMWMTVENDSIIKNLMVLDIYKNVNFIRAINTVESTVASNTLKADDADGEAYPPAALTILAVKSSLKFQTDFAVNSVDWD